MGYIKNKIILCFCILVTPILAPIEAQSTEWRKLDLDKTVLLTLPHGKVVIELAPQFSPKHVAQFSKLVKQGFYDGEKFYRVIDGFVAQGGPEDEGKKHKSVSTLVIEESWQTSKDWHFSIVQQQDLFAYQTGFKDGFAIARDKPTENTETWLTHCPGVLAMARGNEPDTATSHFYFVIGQAPRYLDRIMTVFGRVVYGMNHIQSIQRTSIIEGEKAINPETFTSIISMKLMRDVSEKERLLIEVEDTNTIDFIEKLHKRVLREDAFFYKKPPQVLDVCQVPVTSRIVK
jgi:peptidylprolyl isomerase